MHTYCCGTSSLEPPQQDQDLVNYELNWRPLLPVRFLRLKDGGLTTCLLLTTSPDLLLRISFEEGASWYAVASADLRTGFKLQIVTAGKTSCCWRTKVMATLIRWLI